MSMAFDDHAARRNNDKAFLSFSRVLSSESALATCVETVRLGDELDEVEVEVDEMVGLASEADPDEADCEDDFFDPFLELEAGGLLSVSEADGLLVEGALPELDTDDVELGRTNVKRERTEPCTSSQGRCNSCGQLAFIQEINAKGFLAPAWP
jgi:hypothetical protein